MGHGWILDLFAGPLSGQGRPVTESEPTAQPITQPTSRPDSPARLQAVHRHRERASDERADLDALLDSEWTGVLSTVVDGQPWAVPMLYARVDDTIWLHGSTGAGALRQVAAGAPAVFTVMAVDALVVGPTTFSSSANYRSATIRGALTRVDADAQNAALERFSEQLIPGRTAEVRPSTAKELAQTMVVGLPIEPGRWLYKARTGGPSEPDAEDRDVWAGVVTVERRFGHAEPAEWVAGQQSPGSVRRMMN